MNKKKFLEFSLIEIIELDVLLTDCSNPPCSGTGEEIDDSEEEG